MQNLVKLTLSPLLHRVPGLVHGFTNKAITREEANALDAEVATAKQVHKADLIWVTQFEKKARDADAVATLTPGVAVGVYSADCTPILVVVQNEGKVFGVMAAHGGWRSTALGIAGKAFREFAAAARGQRPQCCFLAAIGPCISFESFEVSQDVIDAFPGIEGRGLARFLRMEGDKRKYLVNLPGENARQLREAASSLGVPLEVEQLNLCTLKLVDQFPSYRRDHDQAGRILSFLKFAP
ncbi:MAG: polyphenol oxidase family protein [Bdellovibrionota bacterium]